MALLVLGVSAFEANLAEVRALMEINAIVISPQNTAQPIEIKGRKFFSTATGEQFFLKGIAYQQSRAECNAEWDFGALDTAYLDPMANTTTCLRDLRHLKDLGVNTVRVYSINPRVNHDTCMNAFGEAGIYVIADLSEPEQSVNRVNPRWDAELATRYFAVVDAMHPYPNMLGFFAGNEVANDRNTTGAAPFVRAAIRDTKRYIAASKYRAIPVGYATNDDAETRESLASYFVCDNGDDDSKVDFYGINMYEWCGRSSFVQSGYRDRTLDFQNYPVPLFFSEFGCNEVRPRPFTEVEALYSDRMSLVWLGGIAYMYFEETNAYGVMRVLQDGSIQKLTDFDNLKQEFHKAHPKAMMRGDYHPKLAPAVVCPPQSPSWKAATNLPPPPDPRRCACLEASMACVPITKEDRGAFLETVCREANCSGVAGNGEVGEYGVFSLCSERQRLGFALTVHYMALNRTNASCSWGGRAAPVSDWNLELALAMRSGKGSCADLLEQDYLNVLDGLPVGTHNERIQPLKMERATKAGSASKAWRVRAGAPLVTMVIVVALASWGPT